MSAQGWDARSGCVVATTAVWILLYSLADPAGTVAADAARPSRLTAREQDQIAALQEEKAARTPAQRKLDSQFVYALHQKRGQPVARGVTQLTPALRPERDGRMLVDLRATVTPALLDRIRRGGGTVLNSFTRAQAIRAVVPLELLEELAAQPEVRNVRPADRATTNVGSRNSEGDLTHRAGEARAVYGVSGEGVRIGVLSDSVDRLAESQATGNLPIVSVLPGQAGTGVGEGTAMLEIIHDLAPDSELFFATAFSGQASFAQNIRDLYAAGCRIIVDDVTYFRESPFQDDEIARAVNDVSAGGALFFSSAGNSGNKDDNTSGTWEGDFVDGGPAALGRDGRLHDFGGTTFNALLPGGGFQRVDFFWSDPLGAATNDYDVYVLDGTGAIVASSSNVQDGDDDPYEQTSFLSLGLRIVIVKFAGEGRYLHLSTGRGRLEISTGGATRGHNASGASNAFSVAATWVRSPPLPFAGGPLNPVEAFSADGPRRMFFEPDGTPITPGDLSSSGGLVVQKPDLTAADGVSTSVMFFESFFGTSASAPHAAAIAALLWSYNPALTPAQIRTAMTATALDIEEAGVDNDSGHGIVMALPAIEAAPAPSPRLVFASAELVDGNGNGTLDPNECHGLYVGLFNRIAPNGSAATGVTGMLVSLSPEVVVDPVPVTFADVPASGTGTNLVPFHIGTTPAFVCGTTAQLQVVVTTANAGGFIVPFELVSSAPGIAPAVVFPSADVPLPLPDLTTVESSVTVSGIVLPLAKVSVSVHLTHTYDSDLVLTLVGPDGTEVGLSSRNGADEANFGNSCEEPTIFDDEATTAILYGEAPFAGAFRPDLPLSAFVGKSGPAVNGTWTLRVSDVAELDVGTLHCWTLGLSSISCVDGGGPCFVLPRIVGQPQSLTVTNGDPVQMAVAAEGTPPLNYQWFFNSTNLLDGQTNAAL